MIAVRKIVQIPASSSRGFSLLAANFEFPHTSGTPKAPSAPKFNNLTREDGIRIASRETDSGVVSFKVAVLGGSGVETAAQYGSAHLLSSAAFSDAKGFLAIHALENLGARITTSCDREKVTFDVSVLANGAEAALTEVLKVIAAPAMEGYIINEMKEQAQVHYNAYAQDVQAQLRELLHQAAYGETSALGHSIFAHNLKNLSADHVLAYRAANFLRENVVVTSNGGITADKVRGIVTAVAGGMASKSSTPVTLATSPFVGGDIRVRTELCGGEDRTAVGVAFPTPAGEEAKAFAVLAGVLQARGNSACSHGGLFSVHTNGPVGSSATQLQKVLGDLKNVATGNAAEFNAVKQKLAVERFLALDGTSATCYLLKSVLTGAAPTKLADVREVTPAQVSAAAQSLLKKSPAVAVLGATGGAPSAATVQKFLA